MIKPGTVESIDTRGLAKPTPEQCILNGEGHETLHECKGGFCNAFVTVYRSRVAGQRYLLFGRNKTLRDLRDCGSEVRSDLSSVDGSYCRPLVEIQIFHGKCSLRALLLMSWVTLKGIYYQHAVARPS